MSYGWIIDKDHLAEPGDEPGTNCNAVGIVGPSAAPDRLVAFLQDRDWDERDGVDVYTFKMYDGDGELYYTGRMITDEGKTEEAYFGPLDDYGMPNAGCTSIRYYGTPGMDCG